MHHPQTCPPGAPDERGNFPGASSQGRGTNPHSENDTTECIGQSN
jgi:hypothetical protein